MDAAAIADLSHCVGLPQVAVATQYGQTAVEGLIQILEYFPSNLKADDLTREQSTFVLAALASTSKSIDSFLGLMPQDAVQAAKRQVAEENDLNEKEFPEDMKLLNPPTVGEQRD